MAGPKVPEFGKWDNDNQNVPYTAFFETARKDRKVGRGGKMINPNDPNENPDLFSDHGSQVQAPTYGTKEPSGQRASRSRHEQHTDPPPTHRRYGESPSPHRQNVESPSRYNGGGRAAGTESTRRGGSEQPFAEAQRRGTRSNAGSESSFDRSPLHQQAKSPGRGVGAPSYGNRQGNGVSRIKPSTYSPDKAVTIPEFGDWNKAGDGFTAIFDNVRKEKREGGRIPLGTEMKPVHSPSTNRAHSPTFEESSKVCCFPWRRK